MREITDKLFFGGDFSIGQKGIYSSFVAEFPELTRA
jgi:hypothetical protein